MQLLMPQFDADEACSVVLRSISQFRNSTPSASKRSLSLSYRIKASSEDTFETSEIGEVFSSLKEKNNRSPDSPREHRLLLRIRQRANMRRCMLCQ
ncbi:hypothetical protein L2E82_38132 [Cichorium intybus]|uniref:Uncharacterized protein n=1 Tax=Cichorium intybus TaxID=13427 RepID=A0ACB9AEV7_CICIN|nr:hypothetical protein L2E82_38132 [Cichorium intybus]